MSHALEIVNSFAVNFKICVLNVCLQILSLGSLVTDPWLECNISRKEWEQGKICFDFYNISRVVVESSEANFLLHCHNPMNLSVNFLSFFSLTPTCLNCYLCLFVTLMK